MQNDYNLRTDKNLLIERIMCVGGYMFSYLNILNFSMAIEYDRLSFHKRGIKDKQPVGF